MFFLLTDLTKIYKIRSQDLVNVSANPDKQRIKELYEGWLVSNGMSITRPNNANVYSETVYNHPTGMSISLVQLNDGTDKIILTIRVNFGPDIQQAISSLDTNGQRSFANGMAMALMQVGAQFNMQPPNAPLQSIIVERVVYGEGLTKQIFFDNLFTVVNGALVVLMRLQDRFGGQSGRSPSTGTGSSPGVR